MTWLLFLLFGFGIGFLVGKHANVTDPKRAQVLLLFEGGREVFNDEVQSTLGVSDTTATRYLDELEIEGKIVQVGTTGRGVVYKKK